jgi:hypothetical protein
MPYINTKLSTSLSKEKETALKEQFGKAIALIPGKSESWLMLGLRTTAACISKVRVPPLLHILRLTFSAALLRPHMMH